MKPKLTDAEIAHIARTVWFAAYVGKSTLQVIESGIREAVKLLEEKEREKKC